MYYTVGELARFYNIPVSTLRFYDKNKIFCPSLRNPQNNYRYYSPDQLLQLDLILLLRSLDVPTNDIPPLLESAESRADIISYIKKHRDHIADEISRLVEMQRRMNDIVSLYGAMDPPSDRIAVMEYPARRFFMRPAPDVPQGGVMHRYDFNSKINNYSLTRGDPVNLVSFGTLSSLGHFISCNEILYTHQYVQLKLPVSPSSELEPVIMPSGKYLSVSFPNKSEDRLVAYYHIVGHIQAEALETDDIIIESLTNCGIPPVSEEEDVIRLEIHLK